MMKRITVFGLGALLAAVSTPALAEEVERMVDADADGHVHISNIAGMVAVEGWSRKQVKVIGDLGRNVEELILERDGDKVTIKVKVPKKGGRGIESDLYIQVPEDSSIDIGTVSADIEVSGVRGNQQLNTVSGDIETEGSMSDVSAEAVSGDIMVRSRGKDTETRTNTVSGDIALDGISGVASVETVSGDIEIDGGSFHRFMLNTVNGDVEFRAGLRDGGKLTAEAVNGDLDLEFTNEVSGRFEIDTFNGDIRNCFGPKAQRTSKYTPGLELSFSEGSGGSRVMISTLNGDIDICR